MAAQSTGLRKNSPVRMDFEMRTRSWYTTRPAPRFRCPTSEFPIWPAGSPTRSSEAWIRVRGNSDQSRSKNGVSARPPPPNNGARRPRSLFDPQHLVVLRDPVGPRGGAGLDLARRQPHDQVGDRAVLGLAGPMGHHGGPPGALRHLDRLDRLRHGADLVQLDENGVGPPLRDPFPENPRVRDEDVVPDDLDLLSHRVRKHLPAVPVVLGETVLDGEDRVLAGQGRVG